MKKIIFLSLIIFSNALAGTCLDTLFTITSFMHAIPTSTFYQDSSFYYSTAYIENIERKYYWANNRLDSIYENGLISWKFAYKSADLSMIGNENVVSMKNNADTTIYTIKYYTDGLLLNDSIEERHWATGREVKYFTNDNGNLDTNTNVLIRSNDSLIQYDMINGKRTMIASTTINEIHMCIEYNSERNIKTSYEFEYQSSGFAIKETEEGSQYPYYSYFKYFETPLSINAKVMKSRQRQNNLGQYNLIGQLIK